VSIEWTGLSPELLLPLDRGAEEPLRTQLERGLREAIRSGRLAANERLPSTRELARSLSVSRGLVVDCFDQLQAEGYLVSRGGSATRVAATAVVDAGPAEPAAEPVAPAPEIDFVPATPELGSFPRADWAWAVREVCRDAPSVSFGYGGGRGEERLRTVLAAYLSRVRGAAARADRIVVCNGFSQGLVLTLSALAEAGVRTVAFESPGYDETGRVASGLAGVGMVPVPVDEDGLRVDALAASGARAVVVTPAHQWPTGVVMSPERRLELVRWAAEQDGFVVEDDYDAEFRYDHDPVGAVQGLAPDRVVHIGTVSKSLAPAVRLGWVVAPAALVDRIGELKLHHDRGSSGLEQLVLARLMESGRFDRHLRRMRKVYAGKRDALVEALSQHAPAARLSGLAAGFHAVLALPAGSDEDGVVAEAAGRGIGLYGMGPYRTVSSGTVPHGMVSYETVPHENVPQLVIGFGTLSERQVREGIARVGDLLR
jgi:GntR family transcriptional regulator/MocR family aminotransferase